MNTQLENNKFWDRVDKISNKDGCWEWTGAFGGSNKEYGIFVYNGKNVYAHRYSWEITFDAIPFGLQVCHHCDNPSCVNPTHLFLGTQRDNIQDAILKGRINPYRPQNGSKNGRSKLTERVVTEVRQLYNSGCYTQLDLAKMYRVTEPTIYKILSNRTWKHVK